MKSDEKCPHCGANMKIWRQRLTPGLAYVLIKFRQTVISRNINKVNPAKNMNLTKTEYNNFQKLRYHALIAKHDNKGYWLLTRRGNQFVKGKVAIPESVYTFRNKIVKKSEGFVTIEQVIGSTPYWDDNFEFEQYDLKEINEDYIFDREGQGKII